MIKVRRPALVLEPWLAVAAVLLPGSATPIAAQLTSDDNQFWHQDSGGMLDQVEVGDFFGRALASCDFDDDGFDDLAVGALENVIFEDDGAIQVIYGTASGLTSADNQFLHQDNVTGDFAEAFDRFGSSLAAGDFNNSGFCDLVVGVPTEDVLAQQVDEGAIHQILGTAVGLLPATGIVFTQSSAGMLDESENADSWGIALAAGDFDGDEFDDLAVGAHLEDVGTVENAGAVQAIYGAPGGLSTTGNQFWHQNSGGITDQSEEDDEFGRSVAAGDFDGDGFDDLAIGVPLEDATGFGDAAEGGGTQDVGLVHVFYGSINGLTSTGSQAWAQVAGILIGDLEENDFFGASLAAGDFDDDGFDDLAVGVPFEDISGFADAGAVNVIYGTAAGLSSVGNQFWHQDSADVPDQAEADDNFGISLTAGDFDGNGFADLVIGTLESLGNLTAAGATHVLYGSEVGLSTAGTQFWNQDSPGTLDQAEVSDEFGWSVAAGSFNGDGTDELAIGVHQEGFPGLVSVGAVQVFLGVVDPLFADGFESGDTSEWDDTIEN